MLCDDANGLFTHREGAVLSFDYWADGETSILSVYVWNRTQALSMGQYEQRNLARRQWTRLTVPLAELRAGDKRLQEGDLIKNLTIQTNQGNAFSSSTTSRSPSLAQSRASRVRRHHVPRPLSLCRRRRRRVPDPDRGRPAGRRGDYYLSATGGSMSNPGTQASPWPNLQTVAASGRSFASGDVLILLAGHHGSPQLVQANPGFVPSVPRPGPGRR
jgi:hypothetical protein